MTAQPAERVDHAAHLLAELDAVAQPADAQPLNAADVQAMDPQQRRAWFASTTGPQRWEVVGRPDQSDPRPRPRYAEDAACQGTDVDLSELKVQRHAEGLVMDACARCPVLAWCAADARDHNAWGLWAGVVLNNGKPSRARFVLPTEDASSCGPPAWSASAPPGSTTPPRPWASSASRARAGPCHTWTSSPSSRPGGSGDVAAVNAASLGASPEPNDGRPDGKRRAYAEGPREHGGVSGCRLWTSRTGPRSVPRRWAATSVSRG